jgi:oligopeptide transport system substrate-binding protein
MDFKKLIILFSCLALYMGGIAFAASAQKELRVAIFADPTSIDPAQSNDLPASAILPQCCESLMRVDAQGKVVLDLAEKWELSNDGKTFTFRIRKGVKFHSGNELKAQHFKYAWTRAIAPGIPNRVLYKDMELIRGAKDVYEGKTTDLIGVQVVDDYTLRVLMDKPHPEFIQVVAMHKFAPLEKEILDKSNGNVTPENLHGTGPMRLVSYQTRSKYEFAAFDRYWGGKPQYDKLTFYVVPNQVTALQQYENGELDIINPPVSNVPRILADPKLSKEFLQIDRLRSCFCAFNAKVQPVFKDLKVRQAFNMAVDKAAIAKVALEDTVVPARSGVPYKSFGKDIVRKGYPYEPDRAKKLLAEAGYPDAKGFPKLNLYTRPQQEYVRASEMTANMLKKNLNIDVKVVSMEFGKYRQDMEKRDIFDFFFHCWTAPYPSPRYHLTDMMASDGPTNFWNFSDSITDDLARKASNTIDYDKRMEVYLEMEQRTIDQAAVLPLWYDIYLFLAKPYVKNIDWVPVDFGFLKLGKARIEK